MNFLHALLKDLCDDMGAEAEPELYNNGSALAFFSQGFST